MTELLNLLAGTRLHLSHRYMTLLNAAEAVFRSALTPTTGVQLLTWVAPPELPGGQSITEKTTRSRPSVSSAYAFIET